MVRVITDSTSGLTPEIAAELDIKVIPLFVHFGDEAYLDGVDLSTDEFYHKLNQNKILPTTAAPSADTFAEAYDELAETANEVLAIVISVKYSATYQTALMGLDLRKSKCRVEVMDSKASVSKLGVIVIAAAKAAQAGASLDEVMALTEQNIARADMRMAFDTLEYLRRGGRIGTAQAFLGSMLKINPIITIKDGYTEGVTRARCRSKAIDYLADFANGFSQIEEMVIEDATTPDEAEMLADRLSDKLPRERIYRTKVSPVVGTHVGPHVLGISVLGERG